MRSSKLADKGYHTGEEIRKCHEAGIKGRVIERNENIEATQRNKLAIEKNKELYKRRQEIVEHPFGTIKRQWGLITR